jgi:hypothetical protein
MVVLMYNGYKVSANLSGTRAGVSFTVGFILAYAISKISIILITGISPFTLKIFTDETNMFAN